METLRRQIKEYLKGGPRSLRDISQELRISEKDALTHLEHLAIPKEPGERLHVTPAECLLCGYVFRKRERLKRPSRCPVCKGERLTEPLYQVN